MEAIKVVFGRIGKSNSDTEKRVIQLIENNEIKNSEYYYLRTFLTQMMQVYRGKQDQESAIEKFTQIVGSYWENPQNEKTFEFDKISAVASVKNNVTKKTIKLNNLSSGEKQIISMLAKIYLSNEKNIIVLIDEPELSLSMEWQRKLLPDILNSENCSQILAITHSPFVFDNELDAVAGPLIVSFDAQNITQEAKIHE